MIIVNLILIICLQELNLYESRKDRNYKFSAFKSVPSFKSHLKGEVKKYESINQEKDICG
jgi:hypothetical protein